MAQKNFSLMDQAFSKNCNHPTNSSYVDSKSKCMQIVKVVVNKRDKACKTDLLMSRA